MPYERKAGSRRKETRGGVDTGQRGLKRRKSKKLIGGGEDLGLLKRVISELAIGRH